MANKVDKPSKEADKLTKKMFKGAEGKALQEALIQYIKTPAPQTSALSQAQNLMSGQSPLLPPSAQPVYQPTFVPPTKAGAKATANLAKKTTKAAKKATKLETKAAKLTAKAATAPAAKAAKLTNKATKLSTKAATFAPPAAQPAVPPAAQPAAQQAGAAQAGQPQSPMQQYIQSLTGQAPASGFPPNDMWAGGDPNWLSRQHGAGMGGLTSIGLDGQPRPFQQQAPALTRPEDFSIGGLLQGAQANQYGFLEPTAQAVRSGLAGQFFDPTPWQQYVERNLQRNVYPEVANTFATLGAPSSSDFTGQIANAGRDAYTDLAARAAQMNFEAKNALVNQGGMGQFFNLLQQPANIGMQGTQGLLGLNQAIRGAEQSGQVGANTLYPSLFGQGGELGSLSQISSAGRAYQDVGGGGAGGGLGGGLSQILGPAGGLLCWVADELWGPAHPDTHYARLWANTHDTPFLRLYRRFGKRWAALLRRHRWLKRLAEPIWRRMAHRGRLMVRGAR